jgi:16S rRNA (guanine527-N7)-methyltransferase
VSVREKLANRAIRVGLTLSTAESSAFCRYFDLLTAWNQRISLTSLPVADAADVAIDRLLIEPAVAAQHLPKDVRQVVDIGSGGGSPAIPLKIVAPRISLRMVESRGRKASFLREVIRDLDLSSTVVEEERAEGLARRTDLAGSVDVVTARAVRLDERLLGAVSTIMRSGALLFLFQGATKDSAAGVVPGFQLQEAVDLLPASGSRLVILRK